MMNNKKFTLLAGGLLLAWGVQAQSTVTGYVFADANGNGKKDSREKGLAQVAVSNGREVVLTDKKGKYTLPIGKDQIISVIKPAGYKPRVNKENLPQFFYIHKPGGSPQMKFKGVAPTGPLPASVDFAFTPTAEKENFTALLFGDPQPYSQEEVDFFAKGVVSEVEGVKNVAFGLSLGDLVGDNLNLMNPYITAVQKVGIPWYNLMGNHDMNKDVKADSLSDETYEAHFGPANYAFNYGKAHFIILDDILYPAPRGVKGNYGAGFRKDQLDFIENDLKFVPKDRLVVLAFHIPLKPTMRKKDLDRLFTLLKDYPHTLSISAHTHIQKQDFFSKEDGWQQDRLHHEYNAATTSGNWYSGKLAKDGTPESYMPDGTPKGYAFLTVTGNQYAIDYKVAGQPKEYRMSLRAPKVVGKGKSTTASVYANFFMGSERDTLRYRVDNGKWSNMAYHPESDPTFLDRLYEWDTIETLFPGPVRRPSNAVKSTHLWRGSIPADLEVGEHVIEVQVKDMFGRTFTDKITYRIEANRPAEVKQARKAE
ncbi:calcineurin-like phosphoesterase C-terminal domain-containing protein [Rufibacter radiotolerans]|uniref:calcineurin-like phosphoesterase C-terminal domain-containing protein n=1 Tax=Rufibacter radiotolerans TaxID=1379910 RepID=UPI00066474EE|nr:calcineurin-like phosphoesterase family protein [Rufibacter radiotolerans]